MAVNAKNGFSLFEVLVAFAVMSMFFSVVIPSQMEVLLGSAHRRQKMLAKDYSLSILDKMMVNNVAIKNQSEDFIYRGWTIQKEVIWGPEIGDGLKTHVYVVRVFSGHRSELSSASRIVPVN